MEQHKNKAHRDETLRPAYRLLERASMRFERVTAQELACKLLFADRSVATNQLAVLR